MTTTPPVAPAPVAPVAPPPAPTFVKTAAFNSSVSVRGALQGPTINDIYYKINLEEYNRLNSVAAAESSITNLHSTVTSEVARLDGQHTSDDQRLTSVETALKDVDTDIDGKIEAQITKHNQDMDNLNPRVASFESSFIIDQVKQTITVPSGFKFIVLGDLEQGFQYLGHFDNPIIIPTATFNFSINQSYTHTDGVIYVYDLSNSINSITKQDEVLPAINIIDNTITSFEIIRFDDSTMSNQLAALCKNSDGTTLKLFKLN